MLVKNIVNAIESTANFSDKEITLQRVGRFQKEFNKVNRKYKKANEDRLIMAHLLSEINEELEESLSNEKRFIASVSHELRTPLTAILGYSELLDDTALNNKQKRYLDSMIQSSNHLLSLVNDLLDVAKIGDNRIELSPREIDLDEVLTDCANLIRSKVANGVNFIVDIPMLEYSIYADDKRMKQIFINLLSNAAKFTKKGSIRFYIDNLEELENNKLKVTVNVDDTGDGIPAEVEKTLFDPFQSTDKTQGTGLGLYISQQIAGMMDGEIVVESEPHVGSRFKVTIVVDRAHKKEIGKALSNSNIMMFSPSGDFIDKLSKEFMNLHVNFQNHDISKGDISASLVQMVASARFYNIAIFDIDVFHNHTTDIAGTLKVLNPDIKLIALAGQENDKNLSDFDMVITKPIPFQRFIKHTEELYAQELFETEDEVDYSKLDILIVEDVELNREYEKEMLDNFFSITCDTAENGAIAVEKARTKKYDAILMDMRMPVMDGLEATRKIREFDIEIPIICMSANVYKEDKLAAEESGMNDFIEKPLERTDIERKLLKLINHEFSSNKNFTTTVKETLSAEKTEGSEKQNISMKEMALKHLSDNFNEEISKKLLNKAVVSIKIYVERIIENIGEKDTPALIEDFHALKGVLSNIGIKKCATLSGELQKIAEEEDLLTIVEKKSELLENMDKFLNEIEEGL